MQLHELRKTDKTKSRKRIARGGKRGVTSGRGQKGQKSRSGRKMRPGMAEFIIRLPKLRGITNKSLVKKSQVLNVGVLEARIENGSVVDMTTLRAAGLIRKGGRVKILGEGTITKALKIDKGIQLSDSAKKKIEAAGGTVK